MGTTIVDVQDVSKRFTLHRDTSLKERVLGIGRHDRGSTKDFWALHNVDLSIDAGSTVGLIGANGSGKSTLLKVMGAIVQPTTGTVRRRGRLAALLELGAGFHQDLTGRENVYLNASILGMSRAETDRCFDEIVDFSGIEAFIDTPVKFYSSGMYVRLAFAVSVHVDPDLLLVDEVLAAGDEPFQRKCMDKIRSFQAEGRTIVLVSHSAEQVGELCDRAVFLRHGVVETDDEPRFAIRALRRGFEEDRRRDEHTAGSGASSRGTITSVSLVDSAGSPVTLLRTGDDLVGRVDVELTAPVEKWMVGFAIETPLTQRVYHVNTAMSGVPLVPGSGKHRVEFRLPKLRLGAGHYIVRVGVGEVDGDLIDLQPQAASFEVVAGHAGNGVLDVETEITPVF